MVDNTVRLSAIVNTFGPGSVIDLREISVLGLSMDDWLGLLSSSHDTIPKRLIITEMRLLNNLLPMFPKLEGFLQLKSNRRYNQYTGEYEVTHEKYPVRVFPEWLFCSRCKRFGKFNSLRLTQVGLKPYKDYDLPYYCKYCAEETEVTEKKILDTMKLISSRFLLACENGHLDDVPWNYFVHFPDPVCDRLVDLKMETKGKSSGLEDIVIKCEICLKKNDLSGLFDPRSPLSKFPCTSRRPDLKTYGESNSCKVKMKPSLRGATNLYFSAGMSALSLPVDLSKLKDKWKILTDQKKKEGLFDDPSDAETVGEFRTFLKIELKNQGIPSKEEIQAYLDAGKIPTDDTTGADIRKDELEVLLLNKNLSIEDGKDIFEKVEYDMNNDTYATKIFQRVVLLPRLREVKVLIGYNRLHNRGDMYEQLVSTTTQLNQLNLLTKKMKSLEYLPGVEYFGEGVFFQLRPKVLGEWKKSPIFRNRYKTFVSEENHKEPYPEDILTHSLSHAFIQAISEVSGYSPSALRERLYVGIKINEQTFHVPGFLIYTASPDSEGSLGGLIQIFKGGKLEEIINRMYENLQWCSSDPICIENVARPNSPFRNHAVCHACLFIPETACELKNEFLDRVTLVGTTSRETRKYGFLNYVNKI